MATINHGLKIINMKVEVFNICQSIPNPFKDGIPGKSWWISFKRKHPELSLCTVEGINKDRAMNLRPYVAFAFYDTLTSTYNANPYGPH